MSEPGPETGPPPPKGSTLAEEAHRLLLVAKATGSAIYDLDVATRRVWRNENYLRTFGGPEPIHDSLQWWEERVHPDDREQAVTSFGAAIARGDDTWTCEYRLRRADKSYAFVSDRAYLLRDQRGRPVRMIGAITDQSEHVRISDALRRSEERFRAAAEGSPDAFFVLHATHNANGALLDFEIVYANARTGILFRRPEEELLGLGLKELLTPPHCGEFIERFALAMHGGPSVEEEFDVHCEAIHAERLRCQIVKLADGVAVTARDVSEEHRAKTELKEREQQLRLALSAAPMGIWNYDVMNDHITWSDRVEDLSPLGEPAFDGTLEQALSRFDKEGRDEIRRAMRRGLDPAAGDRYAVEVKVQGARGEARFVRIEGRVFRDASGQPVRIAGTSVDVEDSRRLQAQLLHAQKMESLGRLAGGIAHDFNNLLTVILGEVELADLQAMPDELKTAFENIRRAAERAASLTRQLLVLARKQALTMAVVDLNTLVGDADRMLRRVLGERVQVVTHLAPDAGLVRVDQQQIEQVLLNLAINARDAMPDGGTLTLTTALSDPGFVQIQVRDSGIGMNETVRRRALDPFFTTKQEGTGLGLATSYSIVKQHGGDLVLQSIPGLGTEVTVRLPRADADAPDTGQEETPLPSRGVETVLLVEDDELVATTAVRGLVHHGYRVLLARNAEDALTLLTESAERIDILVTDVVLPKSSGPELAATVLAERPDTKVLFVSGYNEVLALDGAGKPPVGHFLQKPFTTLALASAVRAILDGETAG